MIERQITNEELELVETLYHPRGFSEVMFSCGDNLSLFEEDKFLDIQMGQIPLLAFDHLIDDDLNLSEKDNLQRREFAGDILCLAARNTGKTFCGEELDIQQTLVTEENLPCIFTSFDAQHVKGVLDKSYDVCKRHPIISDFIASERAGGLIRSPYKFISRYGVVIDGINMKVSSGSQAGDGFFQKHVKRIWVEEKSRESQVVYDKRVDAISIQGCVNRSLGMTDFVKNSPTGKEVEAIENKWKLMNFPQYLNEDFDEKELIKRIKKFGGKDTIGFKVFVGGEVVAGGDSVLDMRLIRDLCYPKDFIDKDGKLDDSKCLKHFELSKQTFPFFRSSIILSRPTNSNAIYVCADVGQEGGITEITIYSELLNLSTQIKTYKLLYNVTLNQLTKPQQYDVFTHIVKLVSPDYLALDSTGGMGEAIYSDMVVDENFKGINLIWVAFNENVEIDFERDKEGKVIKDKSNKPIPKLINSVIWSVQRASHLLYNSLIIIPYSAKLDDQLDKLVAVQGTTGIRYICIAEEDHLWQSFQTFCIAQWKVEYEKIGKKNKNQKVACKSGV